MRIRRPSPFILGASAVVAGVAFVAALTYYGAQEFSGRAADARASNEAMSFAEHSSTLATGDAFDGYIQILRYADDPILNTRSSTPNDRTEAMQRLLYVNVNKFTSLTVADRSGIVLASTDSTIASERPGTAFSETRANLAPANSDIILPEAGRHGYVEYTAPLRDPDRTVWGILIGRADPAVLWKGTLGAAVDGSRNVIINSDGLFSAGVPDELLRQPWHGRPLDNGGVRADIAGVDSICGLAPIGKDTQIDRGLNVASCLPASLIQVERHLATDKQGLITMASAVLAIVLMSLMLRLGIRGGPSLAASTSSPADAPLADDVSAENIERASDLTSANGVAEEASAAREYDVASAADATAGDTIETPEQGLAEGEPEPLAMMDPPEPAPQTAPVPPPPPDIDALTLIAAYEQRNARLAERLRASVQAKLLVATTEADEAYRLAAADSEFSVAMHTRAIEALEGLRERELRAIGQEMFPGLVRLGLSGALRAMRKELDGTIAIELELDSTTDSVDGGAGRSSISPELRLVLYRFAFEATRALSAAGAGRCSVSLRREDETLVLAVASAGSADRVEDIDRTTLAASELSAEAYAGLLTITRNGDEVMLSVTVPAGPVADLPAVAMDDGTGGALDLLGTEPRTPMLRFVRLDEGDEPAAPGDPLGPEGLKPADDTPANAEASASAITLAPRTGLPAAIEALQAEFFGSIVVALEVGPDVDGEGAPLPAYARDALRDVVRETLRALEAVQARNCDVTLSRSGSQVVLHVLSEIGDADFDPTGIRPLADRCGQLSGHLSVDRVDARVTVSADVSLDAGAPTADAVEAAPTATADASGAGDALSDVEPADAAVDDGAVDAVEPTSPTDASADTQHAA